ncbi:MAG: NusG domain II-containing protein [Clostridia bacterium]|nr:NusG domain II-containing protein [Clostridia bacterium]
MKKLLRNRNFYLVLALIVLIAVLLIVGFGLRKRPAPMVNLPTAEPFATAVPAPAATDAPAAEATAAPEASYVPTGAEVFTAPGYVYISAGNEGRWFALPEGEPGDITIKNEEQVNVIRLTNHSVMMASSTCDNQDCVNQGEVSLENLSTRVLYNMILCLPHQVTIELYTQQEMIMMYDAQLASQQ